MSKVKIDLLLEKEHAFSKYLKSCMISPIELENNLIGKMSCYDTFNEQMVNYLKFYFEGETIIEDSENGSVLKSDDFSEFDYGISGYLIEKSLTNTPNFNTSYYYFLNLMNGDFVKFRDNDFSISILTNSISDIGKPARAGLLDDFISFVIGYENLELGDKAKLNVKHIFDICEKWFTKDVNELCDYIEKHTTQDQGAKKVKELNKLNEEKNMFTIVGEKKIEEVQDVIKETKENEGNEGIEMIEETEVKIEKFEDLVYTNTTNSPISEGGTKISSLVVENIFIPSKKFEDMFKPDSVEADLFIVDEYQGSTKNTQARMWFSNVYDESIGAELDALFLTIGKKLYVFEDIEGLCWVRDLESEVEGYTQISSNKLGCSNFINYFLNIYNEVAEESVKSGRIKKEDKWLISDDLNLQILPLLFIACTNTEIANENLTVSEFVGVFKELTGIDIINNPDLYRLKNLLSV